MRKKILFITAVILAIMAGFLIYVERHGLANPSGAEVGISAGQAILIDGKTGKVLYEKNCDEKAYPASTTKIMTAMVVIETLEKNDSPIEQTVKIPSRAVGTEGSSLYLKEGDEVTIEDLLYGLMLVSGNDAAEALAEIVGGDRTEFIKMMNDRARRLGCTRTNFTNPSGLFDENHYTTARDMAVISREAMKNDTFRRIVSTPKKTVRLDDQIREFYNKNKTIHQYDGGIGIKIGYTENSGRTLVAASEKDKNTMICVVMSAPNWFDDAYRLMDYGFALAE